MFIKWNNVYKIVEDEFNLRILRKEDIIFKSSMGKETLPLVKKAIINDSSQDNGVKYIKISLRKLEGSIWQIKAYNSRIEHKKNVTSDIIFGY